MGGGPWFEGVEESREEGRAGATREVDAAMWREEGEAMESIEKGAGEGEVGRGPLEVSSKALYLLRGEEHGRCDEAVEEGGGIGGGGVGDGWGGARCDGFANELNCGGGMEGGLFGSRWVNVEVVGE